MIPVVYPQSVNWFYEKQALMIEAALVRNGRIAKVVASGFPASLEAFSDDVVLIINYAETLFAAKTGGWEQRLAQGLGRFKRRILVNYDCLFSPWFAKQMADETRFAAIFDVSMVPQTQASAVFAIPYFFIPEALALEDDARADHWSPGRPISWSIIAHSTKDRASLVSAAIKHVSPNGFVFSPSLRPFNSTYGLDEAAILRVLEQSTYYIWGSHHRFPYHEALRVPHALLSGAVPVKIDPLYADLIRTPWVYPSLQAFLESVAADGAEAMYGAARDFVAGNGDFGRSICDAIDRLCAMPETVSP